MSQHQNEDSSNEASWAHELFDALDWEGKGAVQSHLFLETLREAGILDHDPRMKAIIDKLKALGGYNRDVDMTLHEFNDVCKRDGCLIKKALKGQLIVPDFAEFTSEMGRMYEECLELDPLKNGAANAAYIPELAKQDPNWFAVSVCTVDGQQWSVGDSQIPFCIQSCSKPITYLMAAEEHGFQKIHHHVGREPSGNSFNDLNLKDVADEENEDRKIPHNPMINAGAIMSCSLVKKGYSMATRFGHTMSTFKAMSGGTRCGFDNPTYLSERDSADRNWCLGYMMQEFHSFPQNTNLRETLEFYFQCCSILVNNQQSAQIAATMANGGVNPTTAERIFSAEHVRNCLSLMLSSGMYDFSGEWAFTIGLPAKSGVAGLIYVVIPNKMGIAVWSPPLDKMGNSWRGIEFVKKVIQRFNFHNFDNLSGVHSKDKTDPTLKKNEAMQNDTIALLFAAAEGDKKELMRLHADGVDIFAADYDARTALHLASSEGHHEVVQYILKEADRDENKEERDEKISPKDRWNRTPLDDAHSGKHIKVVKILKAAGCEQTQKTAGIVFKNDLVRTKSFRSTAGAGKSLSAVQKKNGVGRDEYKHG